MKFTLSWLKDHLETDAPLSAITDALTRVGLEVERVENPAARLAGFVIARVIEAKQHPNADRLRVCMVDAGGAPVQVVCGAPNARTGMTSVFSPVGTYIPGKSLVLTAGVIRGVESNGMLCSAAELELSNDHDGIIEIADDATIGQTYASYAKLDDPVIEINLTPNRPDATGVAGIARDLAAAGLGVLKTEAPVAVAGGFDGPGVVLDFREEDAHLCPAFALRLIRGVRNGPSPDWMQRRLRAIGLRPINALVDITNYITFDRGRPLHVFDAAKVVGALTVRRARAAEPLAALDGKTYALDPSIVVIADESGPESIAGVMGGAATGCDETTTDVLIESALWDPMAVARAGRKLGIITDARYRFERGVDPAFCAPGLELATRMALDLCGGEASRVSMAGKPPDERRSIALPAGEVERLTGVAIEAHESASILRALGFAVSGTDPMDAVVPTWRPDVEGKADLVEEVIRIAGLDRVVPTPLPRLHAGVTAPVLTLLQKRTRLARRALTALGLDEAVTWSFIATPVATLFGGGAPALTLSNPIAADLATMRPSLVPGLVAAAQRNARRGARDAALCEVGQIFLGDGEGDQRNAAASLRAGAAKTTGRHWSQRDGVVDAFDAKADAFALLAALGVSLAAIQVAPGGPGFLHPGRSATLRFGPNVIGWFGELHPRALEALDAQGPIAAFEIILDAVPAPKARPTRAKPKLERSDFMPVERDLAFVVARDVHAGEIVRAAQGADRALIAGVRVFDVYEGPGVPEGSKSIGVALTLQPREKTLTDAEIEACVARVVAAVAKRTGAIVRT